MEYKKNNKKLNKLARTIAEEMYRDGLSKVVINSTHDVFVEDVAYTVELTVKVKL